MTVEWNELTDLTGKGSFTVSRVKLKEKDIVIEGDFELPPLAKLSYEDQIFVGMFVKSHGSIKQMEQAFGVSYPTIKSRLNRISEQIGLVEVTRKQTGSDILDRLDRGEITPREAIDKMKETL